MCSAVTRIARWITPLKSSFISSHLNRRGLMRQPSALLLKTLARKNLSFVTLKRWRCPVLLLRALGCCSAQKEWSTERKHSTFDLVLCVPWLLLARDFSLATHVQITDVAGQPISTSRQANHFARIPREAAALSGVKLWLGVQTYPVLLFESCGIAKLAGLQGRPRLLQPESALGFLLFKMLF